MTRHATNAGVRLIGVVLAGLATVALVPGGSALAKVGVTSAADGDPLGKPPNENERVLRIGIDVQANELITTAANDRAHLVFLDGSSLTVGPNARLVIDRFVYDPNSQRGELAINATKGVFRLVGGKISKNTPITITTPSSTIGIRGGITVFSVAPNQTTANFIFGHSMTVSGGGQTQTATRPGSQIVTNAGSPPGTPALLKPGALTAAFSQLEGTTSSGNNNADRSAQTSGFSTLNSGQPVNTPSTNQNTAPNTTNNTLTTAVSDTTPASQPLGNATPQNNTSTSSPTNTGNPTVANNQTNPGPTNTSSQTPTNPNPPQPPNGPPRTSQTLTGYTGGLIHQVQGDSFWTRVPAPSRKGSVSITTDAATNQVKGTIIIRDLRGTPFHPSTATLRLAGQFVDDKTYAAVTDPSHPSTLRTGFHHPRTLDNTTVLASANAVAQGAIDLHGTPGHCTCEYLTWGWWGSVMSDPFNSNKIYVVDFGTYVAGTPTTRVQMPTTGSATYNGFMVGDVNNHGNSYAAAGTYQNTWNFASRTGMVSANFDHRNYSGWTAAIPGSGGTNFSGGFHSGGRFGSLNGSFYAAPNDPAKYQAGSFSIGNGFTPYKASGIFAGQR